MDTRTCSVPRGCLSNARVPVAAPKPTHLPRSWTLCRAVRVGRQCGANPTLSLGALRGRDFTSWIGAQGYAAASIPEMPPRAGRHRHIVFRGDASLLIPVIETPAPDDTQPSDVTPPSLLQIAEAVAQTPGEPAGSVLGPASKSATASVTRRPSVLTSSHPAGLAAVSASAQRLFRGRLYATASAQSNTRQAVRLLASTPGLTTGRIRGSAARPVSPTARAFRSPASAR
jgi:hypothetical protein